jgi:cytoskeleton protein RodZ
MADIGAQLRETRMRRRIDISEVEAATKIRAKYLRALENEEWGLLPGPTFVKTFLRTYAEYLGLDPRVLVEDYSQRFERPSSVELTPFATGLGGRRERRRRPVLGPGVVVGVLLVALVAALYLLGRWGQDDEREAAPPTQAQDPSPGAADGEDEPQRRQTSAAARRVNLRIEATGPVFVCLVDASGKRLVDAETMQAGDRTRTFRSRRFRVTFGNGNARMRVNNRAVQVPSRSEPVGFELRAGRSRRELSAERRPTCE